MKKWMLMITVLAGLSSCYFWNVSLDNVIRTYYLPETMLVETSDHAASLNKSGDYLAVNQYIAHGGLFYPTRLDIAYARLNDYSFWQVTGDSSTDTFIVKTHQSSSGDLAMIGYDWSVWSFDGADPAFMAGGETAKGDYSYSTGSSGIAVYDLQGWIDGAKAAVAAGTEDDYSRLTVSPVSTVAVPYASEIGGGLLPQAAGDLLAVYHSGDNFTGFTLADISDPSTPAALHQEPAQDFGNSNHYGFSLTGEGDSARLYLYGEVIPDSGDPSYLFQVWDLSDYQNPVINDISFDDDAIDDAFGLNYHIEGARILIHYGCLQFAGDTIYALGGEQLEKFLVINVSDPLSPQMASTALSSGLHWPAGFSAKDYQRTFALEGSRIYVPSRTAVEVLEYNGSSLSTVDYYYVGVPVKGVFLFPEDDYIYALGYGSVSVVAPGS